ncbi:MAG TPA: aminotransferase class V-fold PLP-dependent enzyme [Polyangiaceae bacterium]|nr:aminotransferase class V-fold PLP-dependent enzyme [Polyangiaceae bacterium]
MGTREGKAAASGGEGEGEGGAGEARPGAARASSLELDARALGELAEAFVGLTNDYLARGHEGRVFPETSAAALRAAFDRALPAEGEPLAGLVDDCRAVLGASRDNGHPRMFGYVASPATPVGVYGSLLAAALNQNVVAWRSAPAAAAVERVVVRWLAELVGYAGGGAGGLLTSGGSMANLMALLMALRASAPAGELSRRGLWGPGPPATLYVSDQVHFSVTKAAEVIGVGREQVRVVPSDEHFRLDARALDEAIERDGRAGLRPFCVVASAGTVATGAVDPLAAVAGVARRRGLWLHVDGAYGALAAAVPAKRPLFAGLAEADSLSLDPHKWLYAPVGCGCLLVRDPAAARAAFGGAGGGYVKILEGDADEAFAFWDYGVELSRPFRALGLWLMLRYYGARRVVAAIEGDCALAGRLAELVRAADDFELLAPPALGICCFRYAPPASRAALARGEAGENARLDALNERLVHRVQRGGRAYLSNAELRGRVALRASITNYRTTGADLERTLEAVREAARSLDEGPT